MFYKISQTIKENHRGLVIFSQLVGFGGAARLCALLGSKASKQKGLVRAPPAHRSFAALLFILYNSLQNLLPERLII
jgi:hypothetical protein